MGPEGVGEELMVRHVPRPRGRNEIGWSANRQVLGGLKSHYRGRGWQMGSCGGSTGMWGFILRFTQRSC